jgi:hypothetical protein
MGQLSNPTIAKKQKSSTFEGIACGAIRSKVGTPLFLVKIFTLLPNLKMDVPWSLDYINNT